MKLRYISIIILFQFILMGCSSTTYTTGCNCNIHSTDRLFFNVNPYTNQFWLGYPYSYNWWNYTYPYRYRDDIRRDSRPNRTTVRPNIPSSPRRNDRVIIERDSRYQDNMYPQRYPNRGREIDSYRNQNRTVTPQTQPNRGIQNGGNRSVTPQTQPSRRSQNNRTNYQ